MTPYFPYSALHFDQNHIWRKRVSFEIQPRTDMEKLQSLN